MLKGGGRLQLLLISLVLVMSALGLPGATDAGPSATAGTASGVAVDAAATSFRMGSGIHSSAADPDLPSSDGFVDRTALDRRWDRVRGAVERKCGAGHLEVHREMVELVEAMAPSKARIVVAGRGGGVVEAYGSGASAGGLPLSRSCWLTFPQLTM